MHDHCQQAIQIPREHSAERHLSRWCLHSVRWQRSKATVREQRQCRSPGRSHATAQSRLHETVRRHGQTLREVDKVLAIQGAQVPRDLHTETGGQSSEGDCLRVLHVLVARLTPHVADYLRCGVLAKQVAQTQTHSEVQSVHRQWQDHVRKDLVANHGFGVALRADDLTAGRSSEGMRYLRGEYEINIDLRRQFIPHQNMTKNIRSSPFVR